MQKRTTTREQIAAAAEQRSYRRGFEHTSFVGIAIAINLPRGNFRHRFRSRNAVSGAGPERRPTDARAMPFVAGDPLNAERAEIAPAIADGHLAFLPGAAP